MVEIVAPEFARFIVAERRAGRLSAPAPSMAPGDAVQPVFVEAGQASELVRVAARRSVGLFRPTRRTEVVWVEGDRELAVGFAELQVRFARGAIQLTIPVRCDQTGPATVEILFA